LTRAVSRLSMLIPVMINNPLHCSPRRECWRARILD
jgi:hypothetical protein